MRRLSCLLFASLMLTGCATNNATLPEAPPTPLSPLVEFMSTSTAGTTSIIKDPDFGGEIRVTLEETFVSAAGEQCKRATVFSKQHEAEIVVICQDMPSDSTEASGMEAAGAGWHLMPRIWGRGISQP